MKKYSEEYSNVPSSGADIMDPLGWFHDTKAQRKQDVMNMASLEAQEYQEFYDKNKLNIMRQDAENSGINLQTALGGSSGTTSVSGSTAGNPIDNSEQLLSLVGGLINTSMNGSNQKAVANINANQSEDNNQRTIESQEKIAAKDLEEKKRANETEEAIRAQEAQANIAAKLAEANKASQEARELSSKNDYVDRNPDANPAIPKESNSKELKFSMNKEGLSFGVSTSHSGNKELTPLELWNKNAPEYMLKNAEVESAKKLPFSGNIEYRVRFWKGDVDELRGKTFIYEYNPNNRKITRKRQVK